MPTDKQMQAFSKAVDNACKKVDKALKAMSGCPLPDLPARKAAAKTAIDAYAKALKQKRIAQRVAR
jgi:hypothetical protein